MDALQVGSAPHARGTHARSLRGARHFRFSPACAGNTALFAARSTSRSVQPRMRGEHNVPIRMPVLSYGSAPHARGTPGDACSIGLSDRFSPACAGNTQCAKRDFAPTTVQPRMRGEHLQRFKDDKQPGGSAPHARGTPLIAGRTVAIERFSPACAGNTSGTPRPGSSATVQPRMRGEHIGVENPRLHKLGSAPHARGTPPHSRRPIPVRRFSPACAGNTTTLATALGLHTGSAPHARGTHSLALGKRRRGRFSPACAGNTSGLQRVGRLSPVQPRMRGEHQI